MQQQRISWPVFHFRGTEARTLAKTLDITLVETVIRTGTTAVRSFPRALQKRNVQQTDFLN